MNLKKGFASPVTIGIVAFVIVIVIVIMFGYYVVSKKDTAISNEIQNESAKDISSTEKTSPSGNTNPAESTSKQSSTSNLSPANNTVFTSEDAMKTITFKWTPLVPKPQEPVTYRLRVWQLMQGQNSAEAMRTNQPIVTKDIDNITQATVSGIYTGPCRPPYLCDYVWSVEARSVSREAGSPAISEREAKSPAISEISTSFAFSVKEPPTTDGTTSTGTSSGKQ